MPPSRKRKRRSKYSKRPKISSTSGPAIFRPAQEKAHLDPVIRTGKKEKMATTINYKDNVKPAAVTNGPVMEVTRDRRCSNVPSDNPISTSMVTKNLLYGQTPRPPSKSLRMKPVIKPE